MKAKPANDQAHAESGDAQTENGGDAVAPIVDVVIIPGAPDNGESQATAEQGEQQPAGNLDHPNPQVDDNAEAPFGYKADGTPRKSNQGRRSSAASDESDKQRARLRSVTPNKARVNKAAPISSPALAVVNYQAMGDQVAQLWFSGGLMVFGADWAPDVPGGEPQAVAGAFRDYFKATNMKDLPPGFALCFVLGTYALTRIAKPQSTVATRFQKIGLWFKEKGAGFRRKKAGLVYNESA